MNNKLSALELFDLMRSNYQKRKYQVALDYIDQYIANNYGIFDYLLDMKMNCLIKLGQYNEAISLLDFITKYYLERNTLNYLASKYMICGEIEKAQELFKQVSYDGDAAFNLGKVSSLKGEYDTAKKHFLYAAHNHNDSNFRDKARFELIRISNYERLGSYVQRDYNYYKKQGGKLRNGDVVYVSNVSKEVNAQKFAEVYNFANKPYLIWKIVNNRVYAFPLTIEYTPGYTFTAHNYPNISMNRYVQDYLVIIDENDVIRIADHIQDNDFKCMVINLYHLMLKNIEQYDGNIAFINSVSRSFVINQNDIISILNDNKEIRYYLVLKVLDDSFEVIEIIKNNNDVTTIGNSLLISKSKHLYNVQHLDDKMLVKIKNK